MNPKIYEFDAVIRKVEGLDGAYIEFPWDVRTEFGRGRAAVQQNPTLLILRKK